MQHQPLSSSECFLFVENSRPLYITTTSPYNGLLSYVLFFVSLSRFLRRDGRTFEENLSTDKNYFIFPFVQVLIFSETLKSSLTFYLLIPSHPKISLTGVSKPHQSQRYILEQF
jgi:hypothetical protein